jgi:hypothetical protein
MAEYEGRPDLQRLMIPRYPPYGKRMLRDNGVWACALKQPNVTVVGEAIERITRAGVVTADGTEHPDLEGDDAQTGPQLAARPGWARRRVSRSRTTCGWRSRSSIITDSLFMAAPFSDRHEIGLGQLVPVPQHDHGPLPVGQPAQCVDQAVPVDDLIVEQRRQLGRLLSGMALAVLLTSGRTATARRFVPAHQCRTRCAWYRAKSRSCINFPGGKRSRSVHFPAEFGDGYPR